MVNASKSNVLVLISILTMVGLLEKSSHAQRLQSGVGQANAEMMEMQLKWNEAKKLTLRKDLDVKKLPFPLHESTDIDQMEVGDVGKMGYWHFRVLSIVDEQNCLLSLGSKVYWLTGYPTEGLSDDQAVRLVDPVRLQEPRKYDSVLGANRTVRCLKMLTPEDSKEWEADYRKRFENWKNRNSESQAAQRYKLVDGQEFSGTFLENRANGVIFEDEHGKKVRKQLKDFDEDSQNQIREQIKAKRGKK